LHTPRRTEISNPQLGERIREEQTTVLISETFTSRVWQESYQPSSGEAKKRSERQTVFHKMIVQKETVVHE
jgi:hypothetical protein